MNVVALVCERQYNERSSIDSERQYKFMNKVALACERQYNEHSSIDMRKTI